MHIRCVHGKHIGILPLSSLIAHMKGHPEVTTGGRASWRVPVFQSQEYMSATKPRLLRTFGHAPNRVRVFGVDLKGTFGRLNIAGCLLGRDCGLAGYEHEGCGPTNRSCGVSAELVEITRAAVYPMRNYVYRLVTTGLRLITPLSLPGPKVTISSPTSKCAPVSCPCPCPRHHL